MNLCPILSFSFFIINLQTVSQICKSHSKRLPLRCRRFEAEQKSCVRFTESRQPATKSPAEDAPLRPAYRSPRPIREGSRSRLRSFHIAFKSFSRVFGEGAQDALQDDSRSVTQISSQDEDREYGLRAEPAACEGICHHTTVRSVAAAFLILVQSISSKTHILLRAAFNMVVHEY